MWVVTALYHIGLLALGSWLIGLGANSHHVSAGVFIVSAAIVSSVVRAMRR